MKFLCKLRLNTKRNKSVQPNPQVTKRLANKSVKTVLSFFCLAAFVVLIKATFLKVKRSSLVRVRARARVYVRICVYIGIEHFNPCIGRDKRKRKCQTRFEYLRDMITAKLSYRSSMDLF